MMTETIESHAVDVPDKVMPLVSWVVDSALQITAIFDRAAQDIASTADRYVGSTLTALFGTYPAAAPLLQAHQSALRGESTILTIHWHGYAYRLAVTPLWTDPSGACGGCVQSVLDVVPDDAAFAASLPADQDVYRSLLDSAREFVMLVDADGRMRYLNQPAAQAFGATPDVLTGRMLHDVFPPPVAEHIGAVIRRTLAENSTQIIEHPSPISGEWRWYQTILSPLQYTADQPAAIMIGIDITERKQAEEALSLSEERFHTLFESSSDCILVWDKAYKYLYANQAAIDHVGTTRDQVIGQTIREGLGHLPDFMRLWMQRIDDVFATGRTIRVSDVMPIGDRLVYSDSMVFPLHNTRGEVIAVGVIYRDVTEQKEAEYQALRVSDQLAAIIAASPFSIIDLDVHGRVNSFWNPAAETMFGWRKEDVIGKQLPLVPPGREPIFQQTFGKVMRDGITIREQEAIILRADGEMIDGLFAAAPLHDEHGRIIGGMGIIADITERHTASRQLQQSNEQLIQALSGTVHALARVTEWRDPYTAGHQQRVTHIACAIAKEMGLSERQIELLGAAGLLHDIGKVAVPIEILSKPGSLNEYEYGLIKQHPQVGAEIVKDIHFPWPVADLILHHHVTLDGHGYPSNVDPATISIETRILTVADVVESMSTHRPYRAALGLRAALAELRRYAGIRYDADVVAACVRLFTERGYTFPR